MEAILRGFGRIRAVFLRGLFLEQTASTRNWHSHPTVRGISRLPMRWLTRLQADVIVAFFGFNESYAGLEGVDAFESELEAFVQHTLSQAYNGEGAPGLALVSPIGFEDLTHVLDVPDGKQGEC